MRVVDAETGRPPAVIAGAYQTGVLGVRSLKRRGVRAVCFDCVPSLPGFQSRYGPALECPDPDQRAGDWVAFMIDLARELGQRPVLISSSDKYVAAIAQHEQALREHYRFSRAAAIQGALAGKREQYELAAAHGMPMPFTRFVGSPEEAGACTGQMTFPGLIKPIHFRAWQGLPAGHPLRDQKIAIAHSGRELVETYRLVAETTPDVIVQEIIQGRDSGKRVYLACYDASSRRIASAMLRELRCSPVGFGPASVTEPVDDPEVDDICDRFLKGIGYAGICEIEMKRDERDGRARLIEANPRLSGSGDAAPYAGVDLCWLHYLDLSGKQVAPVAPSVNDFRHIVLRADAHAVPAYLNAGLTTWREIFRSYRRPRAYFDLDWHDWRYSLETLYVCVKILWRGFLGGLLGRRDPQ